MVTKQLKFSCEGNYCKALLLGLPVNPDRPTDKLPYDGAWLMIGTEMVHLMVGRCRLTLL